MKEIKNIFYTKNKEGKVFNTVDWMMFTGEVYSSSLLHIIRLKIMPGVGVPDGNYETTFNASTMGSTVDWYIKRGV